MKERAMILIAIAALLVAGQPSPVEARGFFEQAGAEEKYTPGDFEPAPETMKTRYGTLEFPGGYPTEETVQKAYDELDLPEVPVALFWAVTVYDPWTRSEIQSQPYPSISRQQEPPPVANADGSIDIYFSNTKPKDVGEQNWVKTLPDQGFFVYIRYYGPLNAFNEKTWVPNDVELVN